MVEYREYIDKLIVHNLEVQKFNDTFTSMSKQKPMTKSYIEKYEYFIKNILNENILETKYNLFMKL
jgi:hypothetical protein